MASYPLRVLVDPFAQRRFVKSHSWHHERYRRHEKESFHVDVNFSGFSWHAVNVRSNQERIADGLLREKGYSTFLPLRRTRSRRGDKKFDLELPLFPGYLFCQFEPGNRGPIVTLSPVVRVVGIGKTPVPVDPTEIGAVRKVVDSGASYTPWPYLGVGESVRVIEGPLRGVSGILTQERGENRVVVSVGLIQQSVAAEVERAWVAPLHPRRAMSSTRKDRTRAASAGCSS